jgi:hypothetical protein
MVTTAVYVEAGAKRVFVSAVEWPGWSRSGRTEQLALEALATSAERYAVIAREAGLPFSGTAAEWEIVARTPGGGGTDFGVPSAITDLDRRPVSAADGARLAVVVAAAWTVFDRVVAGAPAELRKGPRGGGRGRDRIVAHVVDADWIYAREIGLRFPQPDPTDRSAVEAERAAMLEVLRLPSDGSPLAGRKWPARYAARRIAWHATDHAWEIEDRTDPGTP